MAIIKHSKKFLLFSGIIVLLAIVGILTRGINLGLEFTGGSLLQISYQNNTSMRSAAESALSKLDIAGSVQNLGDTDVIIRTEFLDEEKYQALTGELLHSEILSEGEVSDENSRDKSAEIIRFESVGPTIGAEMVSRAYTAIALVALGIILYIAWAFRRSGEVISSWKYGLVAILTLIHDISIPLGIWAWLGFELNGFFVVALLSILGLSVNDTIVVFDRIRENILKHKKEYLDFQALAEASVWQTMTRSIFTSLTLILPLLVLWLVGPASTAEFALALLIGIVVGTYSSIFVATPLLVHWQKRSSNRN